MTEDDFLECISRMMSLVEVLLGEVFFLLKIFYSYSESVRYNFICKQLKSSICNIPHKSIITIKMTRQHHRNAAGTGRGDNQDLKLFCCDCIFMIPLYNVLKLLCELF